MSGLGREARLCPSKAATPVRTRQPAPPFLVIQCAFRHDDYMASGKHPICTVCKPPRRHVAKARHVGASKAELAAHRRKQVQAAVQRHRDRKKIAGEPNGQG